MTTRAVGRNGYIRVERSHYTHSRVSPLCIFAAVAACLVLVVTLFFVTGVYEETRGRFMESLRKEKELVEINKALKMEFAAVTQKGYMEFASRKRLGLKQPDDKEVVVLR
jgi:cell division protein FtsL